VSIKLTLDVPDYLKFLEFLKIEIDKEAAKVSEEAALGGNHHDGGASKMRYNLSVYTMGLNKEIPDEWGKYYDSFKEDIRVSKDPEYAEFVRLKNKFEGKDEI